METVLMARMNSIQERLAVCSWSLLPAGPQDLVDKISATGLRPVQLALVPQRDSPSVWGTCQALLQKNGIAIASGMFGCVGENYQSLESIQRTGGLGTRSEETRVGKESRTWR